MYLDESLYCANCGKDLIKDGPLYACDCGYHFDTRKKDDQNLYDQCKVYTSKKQLGDKVYYYQLDQKLKKDKEIELLKEKELKRLAIIETKRLKKLFRGKDYDSGKPLYQVTLDI